MPERRSQTRAPDGSPARRMVLDPEAVRSLGTDLGDEQAAVRVAEMFLTLLPDRALRIGRAVARRDREGALGCVLSLKVTAATIGGRRLQFRAEQLEALLRAGRWPESSQALVALVREVDPLTVELQQLVAEPGAR